LGSRDQQGPDHVALAQSDNTMALHRDVKRHFA